MPLDLTFRRFDLALIHNWTVATSQKTGGRKIAPVVLLELRDDDGVIGYGEAASALRYGETAETALEFLGKIDMSRLSFDDVEASRRYIESVTPNDNSPKGAVEMALLDGAAKKEKRSLHDFLELPFEERKYVSSITIGIDEPAEIRVKVREVETFPILKLKVGAPNDRENLAALREAAPNKTMRVDANEAWTTKEEALRRIEELAQDRHLEFVEQPMPASNPPNDFVWLKTRSPLPIIADESFINANDVARCAECFHGVNVKLAKTSGVIPAVEALRAARAAGLKTMIGCMVQSSIRTSAAAHLASLADWLDLDGNLLVSNDPFRGVSMANGILSFAGAPEPFGLQVAPREEKMSI